MKYKGRRLAKSRRGRKTGRKMRKVVRKLRAYARPDG